MVMQPGRRRHAGRLGRASARSLAHELSRRHRLRHRRSAHGLLARLCPSGAAVGDRCVYRSIRRKAHAQRAAYTPIFEDGSLSFGATKPLVARTSMRTSGDAMVCSREMRDGEHESPKALFAYTGPGSRLSRRFGLLHGIPNGYQWPIQSRIESPTSRALAVDSDVRHV